MRYAFDSEPESSSFGPYATYYIDFTVESQRVSIWHPRNDHSRDTCTVYYFIEFLGTEHHRNELGNHYATLFIGSALHEDQSQPGSRQTSSSCPWCRFIKRSANSNQLSIRHSSSLHLSELFPINESVSLKSTAGLCPWSALDSQVVSLNSKSKGSSTEEHDGSISGNQSIGWLSDSCSLAHEESGSVHSFLYESHVQTEVPDQVDSLNSSREAPSAEEHDSNISEPDEKRVESFPSASSPTYRDADVPYPPITNWMRCRDEYNSMRMSLNLYLDSDWKWFVRGTRWSIRFAPQQSSYLSMAGIRIPPWQASSGRMLSDICRFCARNQDTSSLVLLDPMVSLLITISLISSLCFNVKYFGQSMPC